jgi:hypothetical protein
MEISDQELRTLVRDAIARHDRGTRTVTDSVGGFSVVGAGASHARFPVAAGGAGDGQCLIEPAVPCTHCGYCQSLGH